MNRGRTNHTFSGKSMKKNLGGACAAGPVVGQSPMTVPRSLYPLLVLNFRPALSRQRRPTGDDIALFIEEWYKQTYSRRKGQLMLAFFRL